MKKIILSFLIAVLSVCSLGFFVACDETETPQSESSITGSGSEDGGASSVETEMSSDIEESTQGGGLQNGGIFEGH